MKGNVKFEIGSKEREFKFGTKAIMAAEEALGVSSLTGELFQKLSLRTIVVLTWAALLHSDKRLTIDQVTEWIPFSDKDGEFLARLTDALLQAYLLGKGYSEDEVEKKMKGIDLEPSDASETPTP